MRGWGAWSQGLRHFGHDHAMGCGLPGGIAWLLGKNIKAEKSALSRLLTQHTRRACPSLPRAEGQARATPAESQGALWSDSGDQVLVSLEGCCWRGSGQGHEEDRLTLGTLVQGKRALEEMFKLS